MSRPLIVAALLLTVPFTAGAQIQVESVSPDELQIRQWNRFVDNLYDLHHKRTANRQITETSRVGGYHRYPEFFEEVSFTDKATGNLISKIQWERDTDPGLWQRITSLWSDQSAPRERERLHSIEVYIYDDDNKRVVRDYSATYLPVHRNAPIQTLIALHGYKGDLHAFRSFDASGHLIFEVCRGSFNGEKVDIGMGEDAIAAARDNPDSVMHTPVYRACFENVPGSVGSYHETPA